MYLAFNKVARKSMLPDLQVSEINDLLCTRAYVSGSQSSVNDQVLARRSWFVFVDAHTTDWGQSIIMGALSPDWDQTYPRWHPPDWTPSPCWVVHGTGAALSPDCLREQQHIQGQADPLPSTPTFIYFPTLLCPLSLEIPPNSIPPALFPNPHLTFLNPFLWPSYFLSPISLSPLFKRGTGNHRCSGKSRAGMLAVGMPGISWICVPFIDVGVLSLQLNIL